MARARAQHDVACPDIGPVCLERAEPPQRHVSTLWISDLRLYAEGGLTEGLAVQAMLPLRLIQTRTQYRDLQDRPLVLDYQNIHHRDETLLGPGDLQAALHGATHVLNIDIGAKLGVSVPTGKVHRNPYRLGEQGLPHQHIQFGTGTWDPILGVDVRRDFGTYFLTWHGSAHLPLYEGSHDYQAGKRFTLGMAANSALTTDTFTFRLGVLGYYETAERWNGVVPTEEGNQGRLDVFLGPAVTTKIGNDHSATLQVQGRIYGKAKNAQLELPVLVSLSVGSLAHFEGNPEVRHISTKKADVVDVVHQGEVTPLLPVAGKWTIFDFWAEWCEACKDLDVELRTLAEKNPQIAIRRVNVVDFDSPIVQKELAGVGLLPHIWIFDPQGHERLRRSAGVQPLLEEIRRLIENE